MQERYLIVLFPQDEEDRIQKVDNFQNEEDIGLLHNVIANGAEVVPRLRNTKKAEIFLQWRFGNNLKLDFKLKRTNLFVGVFAIVSCCKLKEQSLLS